MKPTNSEILFKAIYENSRDAIMTLEPPTWKFVTGNQSTLNMFSAKNEEEFLKFGPDELSPKYQPDGKLSKNKAKQMISIAMKNGSAFFEWSHKRINGEVFPATVLLTKINTPEKIFCQATVKDLTQIKSVEEKLRISEEKFRAIFERAGDGILLADIKTKKLMIANPKMCEMTGYTEGELSALYVTDIHPKKELKRILGGFQKQSTGKIEIVRDAPLLRKDGTLIYCDINARPVLINNQKLLLGFFRDVTYRMNMVNSLERSEMMFKESQKEAKIGSYVLNFANKTWTSSEVLDNILGLDKLAPKTIDSWLKMIHPDDRIMMRDYFEHDVTAKHKPFNKEYRIVRQNDQVTRWLHGLGRVDYDKGKPVSMIGTIQDISEQVKNREDLKLKDIYLDSVLNSTDNGILAIDNGGKVVYTNESFAKIWHIPNKLIQQRNDKVLLEYVLEQLVSPKEFLAKVESLYGSKKTELDIITFKNGKVVERFTMPLLVDSNVEGRVWSFRDITKKLETENEKDEQRAKFEAILESIGDAVLAVDAKGKIILFNKEASLMTKTSPEQAIGKHFNKVVNFIKESDGSNCNNFITDALKSNKISILSNHIFLSRKDGVKIPVSDSAAPVKDGKGNLIGCVVVFHDMTREYRIDKAKTEFVSLASHQLRTPLSTINWYSEILLSEDLGKLTPKQKQYSQEVYHASQRMVALVNALLNVSRLELGTFSVDPKFVNVIHILTICLKELKPQIQSKKLIILEKYDSDVEMVKVDPKLMGIIFQNLLSNSVKYSRNGGKIEVKLTKVKNTMLITITDFGIGIPKLQQKEIFTKLYRADNAKNMDPDGTGLGLYIVKQIIEYAGGKVWFTSSEGKGSTFYASLPMSGMVKKTSNKQLI